jgi:hypothetical protein
MTEPEVVGTGRSTLEPADPSDLGKHLNQPPLVQRLYNSDHGAPSTALYLGGGCVRSTPPSTAPGTPDRVLAGRHRDGCQAPDTCVGCQPCTRSHCRTCRRNHAHVTCPTCQAMARLNLAVIAELVGHLPDQAVYGRQAYRTHEGIPGGEATVMMVTASSSWPLGWYVPITTELPGDMRPPVDVLTYWEVRWRHQSRHTQRPGPDLDRAVGYLDRELHRLAEDQAFPGLAKDLARVLGQLEAVLHAGDRADVSRVPCLDCGTRLHKSWGSTPTQDHWRCPVCGQVYDQGRYERAKHDQLASRGAERYVPLMDAVAVTGRPEQTLRAWARLGLVDARRTASGRVEVWWPDVRQRHLVTPTRRRRAA